MNKKKLLWHKIDFGKKWKTTHTEREREQRFWNRSKMCLSQTHKLTHIEMPLKLSWVEWAPASLSSGILLYRSDFLSNFGIMIIKKRRKKYDEFLSERLCCCCLHSLTSFHFVKYRQKKWKEEAEMQIIYTHVCVYVREYKYWESE